MFVFFCVCVWLFQLEGVTVEATGAPMPPNPSAHCPIYKWNLQNKYNYTVSGKNEPHFTLNIEWSGTHTLPFLRGCVAEMLLVQSPVLAGKMWIRG